MCAIGCPGKRKAMSSKGPHVTSCMRLPRYRVEGCPSSPTEEFGGGGEGAAVLHQMLCSRCTVTRPGLENDRAASTWRGPIVSVTRLRMFDHKMASDRAWKSDRAVSWNHPLTLS